MVGIVPNTFPLDLINHLNGGGNFRGNGVGRSFEFPTKKRSGKSAFQDKYDHEEFERIVQMLENGKM